VALNPRRISGADRKPGELGRFIGPADQQRMRRDDLIFMIFVFVLGIMPTGLLLLGPILLK
jgi:hypothetical protein